MYDVAQWLGSIVHVYTMCLGCVMSSDTPFNPFWFCKLRSETDDPARCSRCEAMGWHTSPLWPMAYGAP
eukprot:6911792-Prymnesium_polylepis.1